MKQSVTIIIASVCLFFGANQFVGAYDTTWAKSDSKKNVLLFERVDGQKVIITKDPVKLDNSAINMAFYFQVKCDDNRYEEFIKTGQALVVVYTKDYDSIISILPFIKKAKVSVGDIYLIRITSADTLEIEKTNRSEYCSEEDDSYIGENFPLNFFYCIIFFVLPLVIMIIIGIISGIRRGSKIVTLIACCVSLCLGLLIFLLKNKDVAITLSGDAIWEYIIVWIIIGALSLGIRGLIKKLFKRTQKLNVTSSND